MKLYLKWIRLEKREYLQIFTFAFLLMAVTVLSFPSKIVIYAKSNGEDFIQVFLPVDGSYNEINSNKSEISETIVMKTMLPLVPIDQVRIDPANKSLDVVITKIEIKHLLLKEIYSSNNLFKNIKPLQMIGNVKVTNAGVLVRSSGDDPAFLLKLNKSASYSQYIFLFILSLIVSILSFMSKKVFMRLNIPKVFMRFKIPVLHNNLYLLAVPLIFSIGVAALFYPGFMSYDTLHAIRSARNGVTDSMWPPMVSYVWRAVDLVSQNPSLMHFSQVFLLLVSIFYIVFFFTKKIRYAAIFLIIYLSIPSVLGTVAVIWKDVLMAAFFLAGFAISKYISTVHKKNKQKFIFLSLLAIFLIFLGVCTRHNAITGAVPLLFYLAWIMCSRTFKNRKFFWIGLISLGSVLTSVVFVTKIQLDNYSLPGFVKMTSNTGAFIETVRVLDIAGASLCANKNFFAELAPNLTLDEVKSNYDPRHINLSKGILERVVVDSRINEVWLNIAIHHPVCFFNNKFQLTRYLLGANSGKQFLITAPSVDENEYGYSLSESSLRDSVVNYIVNASRLMFFKPWFLYLLSICALIRMVHIKALTESYLTLFLSAIFYFASNVIFGNAADARLLFYSTTSLSIFTFCAIIKIKGRFK